MRDDLRTTSRTIDPLPILLLAIFVATLLTSTALSPSAQIVAVIGALVSTLVVPILHRISQGGDVSIYLLVPTVLSASQNLYLLLITGSLEPSTLQFLLIVNFLYTIVLVALLGLTDTSRHVVDRLAPERRLQRHVALWLGLLTIYGAATSVLFSADTTSALASYRNLATPLLFTLLGLVAARRAQVVSYLRGLCLLAFAVVGFGFFELFTPGFWQSANLAALWQAKGIGTAESTSLPGNFYSSETVDGDQIRRMVSSFADPVNLGTFLFIAFLAAWYLKKPILMILIVIAATLAVSKGALLGLLIFSILWTRYYTHRAVHIFAIVATAVVAFAFYGFTLTSSTGSTSAHVGGLLSAFTELPSHPLGRGMGNLGVLAGLFSDGATTGINETGFGMILGQLGIVGLGIFAAFFTVTLRAGKALPERRDRLFVLGALLGFMSNAAFNEVAMSPNSAAPYFIALGLFLGRPSESAPPISSAGSQRALVMHS